MTAQLERAPGVDVLIVEDDAPTRRSLRTLLEQQGYTCAEAEDGPKALELALSAPGHGHRPPGRPRHPIGIDLHVHQQVDEHLLVAVVEGHTVQELPTATGSGLGILLLDPLDLIRLHTLAVLLEQVLVIAWFDPQDEVAACRQQVTDVRRVGTEGVLGRMVNPALAPGFL
jgi:CheY-like chemotaxis protein